MQKFQKLQHPYQLKRIIFQEDFDILINSPWKDPVYLGLSSVLFDTLLNFVQSIKDAFFLSLR